MLVSPIFLELLELHEQRCWITFIHYLSIIISRPLSTTAITLFHYNTLNWLHFYGHYCPFIISFVCMLTILKFQPYTTTENSTWYYTVITKPDGLNYITVFLRPVTQVLKCRGVLFNLEWTIKKTVNNWERKKGFLFFKQNEKYQNLHIWISTVVYSNFLQLFTVFLELQFGK